MSFDMTRGGKQACPSRKSLQKNVAGRRVLVKGAGLKPWLAPQKSEEGWVKPAYTIFFKPRNVNFMLMIMPA